MTKEDFKQLFTKQIDDWNRKVKLSDYFEDAQKIPQILFYLLITECSLENVAMEMKSIEAGKLRDFDCSNLELFHTDSNVDSILPRLIERLNGND